MSKSSSKGGGRVGAGRRGRSGLGAKSTSGQAHNIINSANKRASNEGREKASKAEAQAKRKAGLKVKRLSKGDTKTAKAAKTTKRPSKAQQELKNALAVRKTVQKNARNANKRAGL